MDTTALFKQNYCTCTASMLCDHCRMKGKLFQGYKPQFYFRTNEPPEISALRDIVFSKSEQHQTFTTT